MRLRYNILFNENMVAKNKLQLLRDAKYINDGLSEDDLKEGRELVLQGKEKPTQFIIQDYKLNITLNNCKPANQIYFEINLPEQVILQLIKNYLNKKYPEELREFSEIGKWIILTMGDFDE